MSTQTTLATIKQLVKEISSLSNTLTDAVLKGSKDDKIWSVMKAEECDTPHETFNWRFDALFTEDCRDSDGRLCHVRQGKLGMGLVILYLSKINWNGFPLDLVELKLRRLVTELKYLQYVLTIYLPSILIIIRQADVSRPVRSSNLTAKLKDTANISAPELSFQRKAVEDFHSRQAQVSPPAENDQPHSLSTLDSRSHLPLSVGTASTLQNKRSISSIADDDSDSGDNQPMQCMSSSPNLLPILLYHQYSQKEACNCDSIIITVNSN
jgi:hypothetical protein